MHDEATKVAAQDGPHETGTPEPVPTKSTLRIREEMPGATGRTSQEDGRFLRRDGRRTTKPPGSERPSVLPRLARRLSLRPGATIAPPGKPETGFGSDELYIASNAHEFSLGSDDDGTRVWWYMPEQLTYGDSAPAVIYLHGFRASMPDLYAEHINHLTRQGMIVIFPGYNKTSFRGVLSDNDQQAMIDRAIASVDRALDVLGPVVDRQRIYNFGHSLGGLFAACWKGCGGATPHGIVLAHPSMSFDRIPSFVRERIDINQLDYRELIKDLDVPVTVLSGNADTIAPTEESRDLLRMLEHSPSRLLFEARRDNHGTPGLGAGHMGTVRASSPALQAVLQSVGAGGSGDATLQHRFYYAALDAMILGQAPFFDMGLWSDGTPVTPIRQIPVDPWNTY